MRWVDIDTSRKEDIRREDKDYYQNKNCMDNGHAM